jgi:hypothetical protein
MSFNVSASVITLLSNHRHPQNVRQPATLSKAKLTNLIKRRTSPNDDMLSLGEEIAKTLEKLEAEGEIFQGAKHHYCIASPTLLSNSQDDVTWLIFKGDRAYLPLVHEQLKTGQNCSEIKLSPKIRKFDRIRAKLAPIGIRLLTSENLMEHLRSPQEPPRGAIKSESNW